jgi:Fur family transcriptional regulator, ferric uptake regulator
VIGEPTGPASSDHNSSKESKPRDIWFQRMPVFHRSPITNHFLVHANHRCDYITEMGHEPHSPLSELSLEAIIALLHSHGLRVTKGRQRILETLLDATEPLSLEDIQHRSVADGVTPDYATVFRVMGLLEELQVAQRVHLNRSCSYFELLDPQQHYDHLICTQCGRVTLMVDSCPVEKVEQAIGKRYGFTDVRHSLEFFGKCPECR